MKPTYRGPERRKAQRLKLSLVSEYKIEGQEKWVKTKSQDISGKGIRLTTEALLNPGSKIDVKIYTDEYNPHLFTTVCKDVWSKEMARGRYEAGLLFMDIKEKEEFADFICEKLLKQEV